jgi:hypothetical protein
VHPQRQRFLLHSTTLTGLGEFRRARGDDVHLPASTLSQTGQDLYKRPRRSPLDRSAIPALPCPVGHLLQQEDLALTQQLMREPPVQTLAVRRQLALPIRQLCLRGALPLGRPPVLAARAPLLHRAVGEVVIGVVGSSLPVQMSLLPPDLGCLWIQLSAELLQVCLRVRDHRNGRGTQIHSHSAVAEGVLRLLVGSAFTDELGSEAGPLAHLPPDQPNVFHPRGEPMRQHRIRVDARGMVAWEVGEQGQTAPDHPIGPPDQAGCIALALHRVQLPLPLEPHPLGLSQREAQHRPVGAGGQLLADGGIELVFDPVGAVAAVFGIGLQRRIGEPVRGSSRGERLGPLRGVPGKGPGVLIRSGLLDQQPSSPSFSQAGIVEGTSRLQPCLQHPFLGWSHPEGHLAHKGRCPLASLGCDLCSLAGTRE